MRYARLRHHATLSGVDGLDQLVSVTVGPSGEAVAIWSDEAGMAALTDADSDVPPPGGPSAKVAVTSHDPSIARVTHIPAFTGAAPLAQPLPGGRVLVVGLWAEWRPGGPDKNASVFDEDGALVRSACLGDGIQQLLATVSGQVWVAYHDMGIYGNNGWGGPGPCPLGAAGLVRYNAELEKEWEFPGRTDRSRPRRHEIIDDCLAVTRDTSAVWAYYGSELPLARIDGDEVTVWPAESTESAISARALVTDGDRVLFAGGYSDTDHDMILGRLGTVWHTETELRPVDQDDRPLSGPWSVQGHDETLNVFVGRDWYKLDIRDLTLR